MPASCIFISYANFRRSLKHYLIIKVHCLSRCLSSNSDILSHLSDLVNNFFNFFQVQFVVFKLSVDVYRSFSQPARLYYHLELQMSTAFFIFFHFLIWFCQLLLLLIIIAYSSFAQPQAYFTAFFHPDSFFLRSSGPICG